MEENSGDNLKVRITELIAEGEKLKGNKHISDHWDEDDDRLLLTLREIYDSIDCAFEMAEAMFNGTPFERYHSFGDYLASKNKKANLEIRRFLGQGTARTKTTRTKTRITSCAFCGSQNLEIDDGNIVCKDCGHTRGVISNVPRAKSESLKHTKNMIELLIGVKKPPKKIEELFKYIKIWITDLSYIHDWLPYEDTFKTRRKQMKSVEWFDRFESLYVSSHTSPCPIRNKDYKATADDPWTFNEYRMLVTEFHALLQECGRLKDKVVHNLPSDEHRIESIFRAWREANPGTNQPSWSAVFEYEGNEYQIGNYVTFLALTHDQSDFKDRLDAIVGERIRLPGLMVNYFSIPTSATTVEPHSLTGNCAYVMHLAFSIPYIHIPSEDIARMLSIVSAFDAYVRDVIPKREHKVNSMLYSCKLRHILSLPYFYKYAGIARFMTEKSAQTITAIENWWVQFRYSKEGTAAVAPYLTSETPTSEQPADLYEPLDKKKQVFIGMI